MDKLQYNLSKGKDVKMNQNLTSIVVGYAISVNLIALIIIYLRVHTNLIKISKRSVNLILTIIALLGGFVGTLVGAEILNYEQENKLFKRGIPCLIFIEACVIIYIFYRNIQ